MNKDEIMSTYKYFIGVTFDGASKAYYFGTDDNTLAVGDKVVVETIFEAVERAFVQRRQLSRRACPPRWPTALINN